MPSQALSDPRRERARNDELDEVPHRYRPGETYGRCPTCHAPLEPKRNEWGSPVGRPPTYCRTRCRVFAWRRDGDPDGPLNHSKAAKGRYY